MAGEQDGIARAVDSLRQSYEANSKDVRDISAVMDRRFGRQRLWMLAIVAVLLLAVLTSVGFRRADANRENDRQRSEHQREIDQRENLVAGCERGNDQRAALRRVIERGYAPTPIPDGIAPELRELIEQSQERVAALRAEQLADSGVQLVDCERAYPPVIEP